MNDSAKPSETSSSEVEPPSQTFNKKMLGFFAELSLPEVNEPLEGLGDSDPPKPSSEPEQQPLPTPIQAPLPIASSPTSSKFPWLLFGLVVLLLMAGGTAMYLMQ